MHAHASTTSLNPGRSSVWHGGGAALHPCPPTIPVGRTPLVLQGGWTNPATGFAFRAHVDDVLMSTSTVQLVRLVSLKTETRQTSSGTSSSSELASRNYVGSRRRASSAAQQVREQAGVLRTTA